jgi:GT2 family glycosyltransferase
VNIIHEHLNIGTSSGVSIIIPNYNGEHLLRDNIPSVLSALEQWGGGEIIVVDDCSTDNSAQFVTDHFPTARLIVNPTNKGFSETCNVGMAAARFPVFICLNTDVKVELNFISPLVSRLRSSSDIFAVTPRVLVEREGKNQGAVIAAYRRGFIRGGFIGIDEDLPPRENLYAIGACVAYDAQKFRALGGYCGIYSPFLFEDADISYRAWKRGWKSMYEPAATVWHYSNATINKDKAKLRYNHVIYFRNRFIFHWINLSDTAFVVRNVLTILFRLMVSFLWFNFTYYKAFWGAIRRWKDISALRRTERAHRQLGDAEIVRRTARRARNA